MYKNKNILKITYKSFIFFLIFVIPLFSRIRVEYTAGLLIAFSLILFLFLTKKFNKITIEEIFLFSFIIFYFFSAFFSEAKEVSFVWSGYILSWTAFYYFGKRLKGDKKIISKIVILSLLCVLIYCFWQFFIIFPATKEYFLKHPELVGNFSSNVYSSMRLYGTFQYPNSLAAYFILISGVLWNFIYNKENISKFLIFTIILIWLIISFFIWQTGSRLGIIIWLIEVLFIVIIFFKRSKKYSLLILILTFIGISSSIFYLKFNTNINIENITQRRSSAKATTSAKLLTYIGSLKIIKKHPFVGCGPGAFSHYYAHIRPERQNDLPHSAHNIFLEIASTAGIITSIFFLLFILFSLKKTLKNPLIFMSLIMLLIHSCADWNFKNIGIALLFFLLLGLYSVENKEEYKINIRFSKLVSFLFIFLIIFSIYFQIRSGIGGLYYSKAEQELYFNNKKRALEYFNTAININPYRAEYYLKSASAQTTLESVKECYNKAAEYAPQWNEPYYHLCKICLIENNIEEAKYYAKKALQLFPSSEEIKALNDSLINL